MKKFLIAIIFTILLSASLSATAQEKLGIVATVGDEAITNQDLVHRLKIMIISTGAQGNAAIAAQMRPQALRELVDERMFVQAAKKLGYEIEQSQIDEAIATLEAQNNMPSGELLNMMSLNNVPSQAMFDKLSADISKAYLIAREVTPKIDIDEDEVDDFLKAESQVLTRDEFFLQEIVLPVDTTEDETTQLELARKIKGEALAGEDFGALAVKYSKSPSARAGGEVGWLDTKQIPAEILNVIKAQGVRKILGPIRSVEGYYLVIAKDQRQISSEGDNDYVELRQFFRAPKNAKDIKAEQQVASLNNVRKACFEPEEYAKENSVSAINFGRVQVGGLPSGIRSILSGLETAEFSKPVLIPTGYASFLVCERVKTPQGEVTEEQKAQAEELLKIRKTGLAAKKYFRELRATTNIDVRL